jgi:hypothetical protein
MAGVTSVAGFVRLEGEKAPPAAAHHPRERCPAKLNGNPNRVLAWQ